MVDFSNIAEFRTLLNQGLDVVQNDFRFANSPVANVSNMIDGIISNKNYGYSMEAALGTSEFPIIGSSDTLAVFDSFIAPNVASRLFKIAREVPKNGVPGLLSQEGSDGGFFAKLLREDETKTFDSKSAIENLNKIISNKGTDDEAKQFAEKFRTFIQDKKNTLTVKEAKDFVLKFSKDSKYQESISHIINKDDEAPSVALNAGLQFWQKAFKPVLELAKAAEKKYTDTMFNVLSGFFTKKN
jgi:hypothetical protein